MFRRTITDSLCLQRVKSTEKIDDEDGHYIVHEGSRLGQHYRLNRLLGQGTFGKVVQAEDERSPGKLVAVKIIRAVPKVGYPSQICQYSLEALSPLT